MILPFAVLTITPEVITRNFDHLLPQLDTFRTLDWIKALKDIQYVPILSRFISGLAVD
ncbi:MAG TPA: hypothetical protein VI953_00310 [Candidatus Paceibacterota bacterium]